MTLYQFIPLSPDEQAEQVWKGAFLADRVEGDLVIQLYRLGEFYAEVFYDPVANKITRIRGFNSNELLVPYISLLK